MKQPYWGALSTRIQELGIDATFVSPDKAEEQLPPLAQLFRKLDLEPHQKENMCSAVAALRIALSNIRPEADAYSLLPHLRDVKWPGRLELISLQPLVLREQQVLLDGAHNPQSADVLGRYVDRKLRAEAEGGVTWVIAASSGKDLAGVFRSIIRPGDSVATADYTGHPEIGQVKSFEGDLLPALEWASAISQGRPLVIAGSLYLVSDVHRLLRDSRQ
ncbi:uncharacterized protein N7477_008170 [Penicillium maclennaniae]|uniref:uncharacterized protein n=1 Tax=Penicillium maclennaniae TaxID=1343394 RepID=UPI00253F8260|nr:uncharacterized protein N7477_008170 [Penicillium maclennaniae]KAJ5665722.1 hypothetical protein N7477_008170 [Penicillium maclennaniae]